MGHCRSLYDSKAHKIHVGKDIENDTGNKIKEKNLASVSVVNDNIIEIIIAISVLKMSSIKYFDD